MRGLTRPNAQSCLISIADHAEPIGPYGERTAGQRRLDAAVDLLTGRTGLPFDAADEKSLTDEEPAAAQPLRTTADLWTLLHDMSTWHDWPDPSSPSAVP